jgi:hypothetical protein
MMLRHLGTHLAEQGSTLSSTASKGPVRVQRGRHLQCIWAGAGVLCCAALRCGHCAAAVHVVAWQLNNAVVVRQAVHTETTWRHATCNILHRHYRRVQAVRCVVNMAMGPARLLQRAPPPVPRAPARPTRMAAMVTLRRLPRNQPQVATSTDAPHTQSPAKCETTCPCQPTVDAPCVCHDQDSIVTQAMWRACQTTTWRQGSQQ